jgi:hypothetical protein
MRPLCLLLLTTACNGPTTDAEDTDVATLTFANGYPTDDPLYAGQQRFLYETFGTEILGDWPPVDFMLDLLESEPEVFGEQFSAFGFLPDPTDDLPIGLKRGVNDPTELHETCGLCHVDRLPDDTLWLGKPASRLDFGAFQVAVNERWVAAGHDPLFDEDVAARNLVAGPGRQRISSSDYDPAVIADLPPYFQLGARTALNYMGTGRDLRTEIHFSIFAFGAGAPNAAEARVPFPEDDVIDELTAFMGSLDAPPPATTQDPTLVARGEEVFTEAHCLDCHPHDVAEATNTPLDTG